MGVNIRLSVMMFLQYGIWGAWYVTAGNFMSAHGMASSIHWAYTVSPIAAIVSPFFLAMIADRFFSTEKVLGVLHLVGGLALVLAPSAAGISTGLFLFLLLVNMLCYMPTVGLTNSLAFSHLDNQEKQFPVIRVFGTLGWIAAGIFVSGILGADQTATPFIVAGIASFAMGLFSFTLPHTPPPAAGQKVTARSILGIDAFNQIKSRPFIVFLISAFLLCIPLAVYYSYAPVFVNDSGISNPAFKMSFGQMSEAFFILLMPFLFPILGIKRMLLVGMGAWALRYVLFSLGAPDAVFWMILGGIILHGICYDFFFVAGFIYVDKAAVPQIRAQAQGFVVLATYGLGMLIGTQVGGMLFNKVINRLDGDVLAQWQHFWIYPAVLAFAVMIFFGLLFKDKGVEKSIQKEGA